MTSLVSCCARIVNQNKWPTLLHDRADVTVGYVFKYCLKLYLLYLIIIVSRDTGKISLLLLTVLPSWNKVITYLLTVIQTENFFGILISTRLFTIPKHSHLLCMIVIYYMYPLPLYLLCFFDFLCLLLLSDDPSRLCFFFFSLPIYYAFCRSIFFFVHATI